MLKRRLFGYSVKETDAAFRLLRAENERLNVELRKLLDRQRQFDFDVEAAVQRKLREREAARDASSAGADAMDGNKPEPRG